MVLRVFFCRCVGFVMFVRVARAENYGLDHRRGACQSGIVRRTFVVCIHGSCMCVSKARERLGNLGFLSTGSGRPLRARASRYEGHADRHPTIDKMK